MRAQLSLELLLYLALAGLSFAVALHAVSGSMAKISNGIGAFEVSQFVDTINSHLFAGSQFSIKLYLPQGLCNSTVSGASITTRYGAFVFVAPVAVQQGALCPDGVFASLNVSVLNGSVQISRG